MSKLGNPSKQHILKKLSLYENHLTAKPKILSTLLVAKNATINTSIQTYKTIEDRFKHHLSYVVNNTQATGQHFNSQGHNSSHITISVLEKVHQISKLHREQRESHWIEKYNLKYWGMNKKS